jgi:hypothetical protein
MQARKAEKVLELVRYLEDRPPFHRVFWDSNRPVMANLQSSFRSSLDGLA